MLPWIWPTVDVNNPHPSMTVDRLNLTIRDHRDFSVGLDLDLTTGRSISIVSEVSIHVLRGDLLRQRADLSLGCSCCRADVVHRNAEAPGDSRRTPGRSGSCWGNGSRHGLRKSDGICLHGGREREKCNGVLHSRDVEMGGMITILESSGGI